MPFVAGDQKRQGRIKPQPLSAAADQSLIGFTGECVIDIDSGVVSLGLGRARDNELLKLIWASVLPNIPFPRFDAEGGISKVHTKQVVTAINSEANSAGKVFLLTFIIDTTNGVDERIKQIGEELKINIMPRTGQLDNDFKLLWVEEGDLATTIYIVLKNAKKVLHL
jgi:hypothetical protein